MSIKDVRFGCDFLTDTNIKACMASVKELDLTFACLPVSSLRLDNKPELLDPASTVMNPSFYRKWCHCVVAKTRGPADVDSPDQHTRLDSEKSLARDISWATFLNVYSVMLELPLHGEFANLARLLDNQIEKYLKSAVLIQFWILIPITDGQTDPWKKWAKFISSIRNVNRMKVTLEIGPELPSAGELDRWLGESVAALVIDAKVFVTNKKGYPVLLRRHQEFVKKMFNVGCQIVVSGPASDVRPHLNYLSYLYRNTTALTPYSSELISGFEDCLQTPLQPLKHNLQSHVYETFEQDPIKYHEYGRAISKALADKSARGEPVVVYVVGAGRGPLVDATLAAADGAGVRVTVCAVEKNGNAVPALLLKNRDEWHGRVTVVHEDMRSWRPAAKCDVLVSELLGSFGDNELSPECLDGAQRYLKPDGVSIPSRYTSYLGPIQSRKLHAEISSVRRNGAGRCNFQRPYVVQLNNVYGIAAAQPLFAFVHPRTDPERGNDRDGCLTFGVRHDCVLHGLAGYFETVLYKDVSLSIVPETFSNGMFSWFPAYFPLVEPVPLRVGDQLQINFWRRSDKRKVWYEWCVAKPYQSVVHNVNGGVYYMSL